MMQGQPIPGQQPQQVQYQQVAYQQQPVQYQQVAYQQQPVQYQQVAYQQQLVPDTNATLALILSIVGITLSFMYGLGIFFAIPSLILANRTLNITNQFPNHPNAGTAKAAKICSIIAICLSALGLLTVVLAGVLYVWASSLN